MSELDHLTNLLVSFRDARNWKQFHSLKNLIISLDLEAAELLELTQWKSDSEVEDLIATPEGREAFADECADVLLYLLLIAERTGIDPIQAALSKLDKNNRKYPVEKSWGSNKKYSDLT